MRIKTAGYLLLNKKPGYSSFESLFAVKKAFGTGKVCHTGTLDKFAGGLLVVLVGGAVKLSSWFTGCDKRYRGTIKLGEETDTLDPEGTVIFRSEICSREAFESAMSGFTGDVLQAPPEYSALHINGKRAYELARRGIRAEMKKRPVTIYSAGLSAWNPPFADIEVHCSKGTYIRSLARDIALAAGTRAFLSALTRTAVGGFSLENAVSQQSDLCAALRPIDRSLFALLSLPVLDLDKKAADDFSGGKDLKRILEPYALPEEPCLSAAVFGPAGGTDGGGGFKGMIQRRDDVWKYGYVNAGC
ncbi:MAG: tRNA pseudouridine(55) synthase TruB [Treponema sp.]|jgi:tRNA pseudouridine55 synthase|nr:tRNA pseudouridine(55) synthase TruB [Treponema sp.]